MFVVIKTIVVHFNRYAVGSCGSERWQRRQRSTVLWRQTRRKGQSVSLSVSRFMCRNFYQY